MSKRAKALKSLLGKGKEEIKKADRQKEKKQYLIDNNWMTEKKVKEAAMKKFDMDSGEYESLKREVKWDSGALGTDNIIDEVKQIVKATVKRDKDVETAGQKTARSLEGIHSTREGRKIKGKWGIGGTGIGAVLLKLWDSQNDEPPTEEQLTALGKAVEKAEADNVDVFTFIDPETGLETVYNIPVAKKVMRQGKKEGSKIEMPSEYSKEAPVDTYPNMTPEEEAMPIDSDEKMEEEYIDYVTAEVLNSKEQDYLNKALDKDPKLEGILDKVIIYASEFSGSGEVDGPGTGISDSIPARLSDGEFVFTRKATDQLGADNLQKIMDNAERQYDRKGGLKQYQLGGAVDDTVLGGAVKDKYMTTPLTDEKVGMFGTRRQQDELRKQMMYANRMPSIIGR